MKSDSTSVTFLIYPEKQQLPSSQTLEAPTKQPSEESRVSRTNSVGLLRSTFSLSAGNSAFSVYDADKNKEEQLVKDLKERSAEEQENLESGFCPQFTNQKSYKDRKELSRLETKNLNRFFRSKINQMLRDIKENPHDKRDEMKAQQLLSRLNQSNKIMFSEMREVIKDEWLQEKLCKCESMLMRYVHRGKMGMSSKLVMLKYFNKILKAIKNPDNFTCWK